MFLINLEKIQPYKKTYIYISNTYIDNVWQKSRCDLRCCSNKQQHLTLNLTLSKEKNGKNEE
jgi:hypothetical protein